MTDQKKPVTAEETTPFGALLASDDAKNYLVFPKVGDVITGTVISASNSEVHVDIPGLGTGIIRGRELYQEAADYSDLEPGQEVEATVVDLESEDGELELSFRSAGHKKVWAAMDVLRSGANIVKAEIIDANRGGLMVKVNRVKGFLPVSQLSPEHYPRVQGGDKNKILERLKSYIGQNFDVKVITVDDQEEKLIVSEKAAWEEQQSGILDKYTVGDTIDGKVTAVTDFGAFVEFGENLEGLVHISELAWQRIDDPKSFIKVGDKVKAKIIKLEGSKIFLSMKELVDDPWANVEKKYAIGQKVSGKVLKANPFGLFVELDDDIHGLAHISELSDKPVDDINKFFEPNKEMEFVIISIEPKQHRLGLSLKRVNEKIEDKKDKKEDKKADKKKAAKKEEITEVVEEVTAEVKEEAIATE